MSSQWSDQLMDDIRLMSESDFSRVIETVLEYNTPELKRVNTNLLRILREVNHRLNSKL